MAFAIMGLALIACQENDPKKNESKIAIDVQISDYVKANVTVTPENLETPYYFSYFEKDYLVKEGLTQLENSAMADTLFSWLLEEIEYYNDLGSVLGDEEDYSLADFLISGKQSAVLTLEPSTDYIFVAFYVDTLNNNALSGISTAEASSEALPRSNNKITLAYNNETGLLDITTTNNDPYYVMVIDEDYYDLYVEYGYSDAEILEDDITYQIEYWDGEFTAEDFLFSGTKKGDDGYDFNYDYGGLDSGTYYALAGAYLGGYIIGDVAKIKFEFEGDDASYAPARIKRAGVAPKSHKNIHFIKK